MNKQQGISSIIVLFFVLIIAGGVWYFLFNPMGLQFSDLVNIQVDIPFLNNSKTSFGKIPEPENTPEIINNNSLYEMDKMMDNVENNIAGEDFSDLELK